MTKKRTDVRKRRSTLAILSVLTLVVTGGSVPIAFATDLTGVADTTTSNQSGPAVVESIADEVDDAPALTEVVEDVADVVEEIAKEVTEPVEEVADDTVADVVEAVEPEPEPSPSKGAGEQHEPGRPDGGEASKPDRERTPDRSPASDPRSAEDASSDEDGGLADAMPRARDLLPPRPEFDPTYPLGPELALRSGGPLTSMSPRIDLAPLAARGPRTTLPLLELLSAGATPPAVLARILAPFPVAGPASYADDWGAPRHDGRTHQGVDIFADRGTPVIASVDGVVSHVRVDTAIGGNSLRVTAPDATFYYYAHLDGFAEGIANGVQVSAGQTIGFVGDSGNALGTPPHLHFQIHPRGGDPVPPVPYLDRWLAEAMATAQTMSRTMSTAEPVAAPRLDASPPSPAQSAPAPLPPVPAEVSTAAGVAGADDQSHSAIATILVAFLSAWFLLHRGRRPQAAARVPAPQLDELELILLADREASANPTAETSPATPVGSR